MSSIYYIIPNWFGTGLSNQLFFIIWGIINSFKNKKKILIIDKFRQEPLKDSMCYISEVLDLDYLNTIVKDFGIETIAIQSNDPLNYPEDSFENMKRIAHEFHFSFPYVIDETQEIAKAYNAICTPDFFGFNRNLALQYRGRFDATGRGDPPPDNTRDLYEAMKLIAETQSGPIEQKSSIGCSIKWRE